MRPSPTYTAGGGSVVVNWGDGSAPQTLTASNLTAIGTPNGVIWTITAAHTYAEEGTYAYTVTVTDDGGATTIVSGSAIIADAPLTASATQPTVSTDRGDDLPGPGVRATAVQWPGRVASPTPTPRLDDRRLQATIDWGDGTPLTAGTISQPGGVGTAYIVSGSHTYADSGVTTGTGNVELTRSRCSSWTTAARG